MIDFVIFINTFVLAIASFAGYLFVGSLNKWIGSLSISLVGLFGFLVLLTRFPNETGINLIPDFIYGVPGFPWLVYSFPLLVYVFLILFLVPILFFIGSATAKTIPGWKWSVLLIVPVITLILSVVFNLVFSIRDEFNWTLFSRGMAVWIIFAAIIFSELIRTRVKKSYLGLTVILSVGALVLSSIILLVFSYNIYQKWV